MGTVIILIAVYVAMYMAFLAHIIYEYNNIHESARKLAEIERQLNTRQAALNNPMKRLGLAKFNSNIMDAYKKGSSYYTPERLAKVIKFRRKVIKFTPKTKV